MDYYYIGWIAKWIEQMDLDDDLPNKFFLHGHSYGAYISSLYACSYPERIAALFLNSPAGPEAQPENFNKYELRIKTNMQEPGYPKEIDFWQQKWEQLETPLTVARKFPLWMQQLFIHNLMKKDLDGYPEKDLQIVKDYCWHHILPGSESEKAITF